MPPFRILVDTDEVLADFGTPALRLMSHILDREVTRDSFTKWDLFEDLSKEEVDRLFSHFNCAGFCSDLEILEGAKEGVAELQKLGDVYVVTSPIYSSPTWTHERNAWLYKHFGIPSKKVVHTSAKYMIRGDVLLDDRPDNLHVWMAENPRGLPLLWHIPNTSSISTQGVRVRTWDQVVELVSQHKASWEGGR
jgi:5'(3')-deoxyribonucleotidase